MKKKHLEYEKIRMTVKEFLEVYSYTCKKADEISKDKPIILNGYINPMEEEVFNMQKFALDHIGLFEKELKINLLDRYERAKESINKNKDYDYEISGIVGEEIQRFYVAVEDKDLDKLDDLVIKFFKEESTKTLDDMLFPNFEIDIPFWKYSNLLYRMAIHLKF